MTEPVYRDPEHEWLWQQLCSITNKKYRSNSLAFAWMTGFLISLVIDLMRNDSAVKSHVIKRLQHHKQHRPPQSSLSRKE